MILSQCIIIIVNAFFFSCVFIHSLNKSRLIVLSLRMVAGDQLIKSTSLEELRFLPLVLSATFEIEYAMQFSRQIKCISLLHCGHCRNDSYGNIIYLTWLSKPWKITSLFK